MCDHVLLKKEEKVISDGNSYLVSNDFSCICSLFDRCMQARMTLSRSEGLYFASKIFFRYEVDH